MGDAADLLPFGGAVEGRTAVREDAIDSARSRSTLRKPGSELCLLLRRDVGNSVAFPELLSIRTSPGACPYWRSFPVRPRHRRRFAGHLRFTARPRSMSGGTLSSIAPYWPTRFGAQPGSCAVAPKMSLTSAILLDATDAVLTRQDAIGSLESAAEMRHVGKSPAERDLAHAPASLPWIFQRCAAPLQPPRLNQAHDGHAFPREKDIE